MRLQKRLITPIVGLTLTLAACGQGGQTAGEASTTTATTVRVEGVPSPPSVDSATTDQAPPSDEGEADTTSTSGGDGADVEANVDADTGPGDTITDQQAQCLQDEGFEIDASDFEVSPELVDKCIGGGDGEVLGTAELDEQVLGTAEVDGDQLDTSAMTSEAAARSREIWQRFTELIPADQRRMVTAFELVGGAGFGGHVYRGDTDADWTLGVLDNTGDTELDSLLIHEFAHLLTLNAAEVESVSFNDNGSPADSCGTLFTGDGCALDGSIIDEFAARFWPTEHRTELAEIQDKAQATDSEEEAAPLFESFHQRHADRFVSEYAASDIAEDIAETFLHFVMKDRPTGDSVAEQKIDFFWGRSDLVELREQIRSGNPTGSL